ncbi:MAG: class I SAM-dependent methyltransferase [Bdellovibrionales bacterium]
MWRIDHTSRGTDEKSMKLLATMSLFFYLNSHADTLTYQKDAGFRVSEWLSGQECTGQFNTSWEPPSAVTCSTQKLSDHAQKISKVSEQALENYEQGIFLEIHKQQVDESKCAELFLEQLDQSLHVPYKNAFEKALYHIQNPVKPNSKSQAFQAQEQILTKVHKSLAVIRALRTEQEKVEAQLKTTKFMAARSFIKEPDQAESYLATLKSAEILEFQKNIWSGNDPLMKEFAEKYLSKNLPFKDFLSQTTDPRNRFSFQALVVAPMRDKNRQRLEELSKVRGKIPETLKKDFVQSGASIMYLNSNSNKNKAQSSEIACYLEGRYGSGRDLVKVVYGAAAGAAGMGSMIAFSTGLPVVGVALTLGSAYLGSQITESCGERIYVSSGLTQPICEQLKSKFDSQNFAQVVSKTLDGHSSCLEATLEVAAALPPLKLGSVKGATQLGHTVREVAKTVNEAEKTQSKILKITEVRHLMDSARNQWEKTLFSTAYRTASSQKNPVIQLVGNNLEELNRIRAKEFYRDVKEVLLLAEDAGTDVGGYRLAKEMPNIKITATDIKYSDEVFPEAKNFVKMKMDNSKPFPFPSNHFDKVIMHSGTCWCGAGSASCGGIGKTPECIQSFFREAARVLNKGNPHAEVTLIGEHGRANSDFLKAAAQAFADEGQVQVTIVEDGFGLVQSLRFTPRAH